MIAIFFHVCRVYQNRSKVSNTIIKSALDDIISLVKTVDNILKVHLPKPKFKILDVITKRWSPRHYLSKKIPQEHINQMIEAARWTPSGHNLQPWHFYYAQKPTKAYDKLENILSEYNHRWAKSAPLLIVACIDTKEESQYANYDLGAAVFSLVLQAHSLGYYCRQMALFDHEEAKKMVKKNHLPYIIIAIGKLGDYEKAEESVIRYESDPRPRKENIAEELK
jgi:nitroreductase